jgi:hypothetical protein
MNPKKIKEQLDSPTGKDLKDYLLFRFYELKSIDNIKEFKTPTHQSIEIKSQRRAFKKLEAILSELMTIEDLSDVKSEQDSYYA